jgi:HEAT repeat protein
MVKVMPAQISTLLSRHPRRISRSAVGCALLVLGHAIRVEAAIQDAGTDDGSFYLTYGGLLVGLVLLGLVGLLLYRRRPTKAAQGWQDVTSKDLAHREQSDHFSPAGSAPVEPAVLNEGRAPQVTEPVQVWEKSVEVQTSIFGAYRIDQEVNNLVNGKPHRTDVMASRAADDRRAIEASLIKALESPESNDEGRRRARQALEEYGFVARQSAAMLMGRDAWERSSAARSLGQIGAPSSLSFLIEALHDSDSVVRNQAVASLGALKMPAAIGALLDIARRHSDIPTSLLAEALSSCSVESLGYLDAPSAEPAILVNNGAPEIIESERLDDFEALPAGAEDGDLADLLSKLSSDDKKTRVQAVAELSLHPVQRAVDALASVVLYDGASSVRSAAVNALGSIDHESVFAPVLIALADEFREVRAAAARTLTSLHFDRADAYVRVMETADPETMRSVARACVKTGIVGQSVDRLASEDRRQAYEAFSLFSLLAKANESQPILNVIENHKDEEVRLCAVRVLNTAGQSDLVPALREMVGRDSLPESVRTALLEVLYKLDQDQPLLDLNASDNEAASLHNSL